MKHKHIVEFNQEELQRIVKSTLQVPDGHRAEVTVHRVDGDHAAEVTGKITFSMEFVPLTTPAK